MEMGRRGGSGDCIGSCMQTTWFCGVRCRKILGEWWDALLVCRRRGLKVDAGKSKVMKRRSGV